MSQPTTRYLASGGLRYAYWQDEVAGVVYNRRSGDTHLVNLVGLHILQHVAHDPVTLAQVCAAVAVEFDLQHDEVLQEQLKQLLHRLSHQGLIKRYLF